MSVYYYQNFEELYLPNCNYRKIFEKINNWLTNNLDPVDWRWSLTRAYDLPRGIYFDKSEDIVCFRLAFPIDYPPIINTTIKFSNE